LAIAGPIAALIINNALEREKELGVEKNNLIDRYAEETGQAASKVADLSRQLDLWEGRANPWDFWPPKRNESPTQKMVADLLSSSSTTLANQMRDGRYEGQEAARGYLGLAMLATTVRRDAEARKYYQLARDQLIALRQENPRQLQFSRALGECYIQLARLAAIGDRDQATKDLQSARRIYQQLAKDDKDARSHIDWLESELASATLSGFASAQEHLARAAEINRMLPRNWPTDPNEVYELACYLSQKEPFLLDPAAAEAPEASPNTTLPSE
jgi:hypothetical protein